MNDGASGAHGRGRPTAGLRVGILSLETRHDLVVGNMQHAGSFDFPVAFGLVRNVSLPALMAGDEGALPPVLAAIRDLERLGVELIVGACGSFGHYQRAAAEAASVPVCLSPLVYVPFLLSILPTSRKLGIIFARTSAFTAKVRQECGIVDDARLVPVGAEALPAFAPILDPDLRLDSAALQTDLITLSLQAQKREPIGAWLLQCSDLPPYAAALAAATGRPVFDMLTITHHLHRALGFSVTYASLRSGARVEEAA